MVRNNLSSLYASLFCLVCVCIIHDCLHVWVLSETQDSCLVLVFIMDAFETQDCSIDNYYYPNRRHLQFKMHLCDSHWCPEAVVIENCKNTNCITIWNRKYTENIVWKWAVQMSHPESFLLFVLFQTFPITPHRHILQNDSIMWLIMRFLCVSFIIHVPVSIEHHRLRQNVQNGTLLRPCLYSSPFFVFAHINRIPSILVFASRKTVILMKKEEEAFGFEIQVRGI